MISVVSILEEYGITTVSAIVYVGLSHRKNHKLGAGCLVDIAYVFPLVAGCSLLRGKTVVRDLQKAVLKGGLFEQVPRGFCSLFACVTKAKEAGVATANTKD